MGMTYSHVAGFASSASIHLFTHNLRCGLEECRQLRWLVVSKIMRPEPLVFLAVKNGSSWLSRLLSTQQRQGLKLFVHKVFPARLSRALIQVSTQDAF